MKEELQKLRDHLKDMASGAERLENLRDSIMCDEHYDVVSKQYGYLCDYMDVLIERIKFEEEYLGALGLLD